MNTLNIGTIEELIYIFNVKPNSWIFRGQANADWQIESSLERLIGSKWNATEAKKHEEWSYDEFKSRFHLYDLENRTPMSKLAWFEVLPVSGTGESLILSHRKDLEDGSEEDSIEVKRHTSALHR